MIKDHGSNCSGSFQSALGDSGRPPGSGQWARGRKARCGFGAGRQVMVEGENVTEPDCAQGLTKGILKMTPFLVGSIAVYNTD